MSLYRRLSAAQNGQAFLTLARRFRLSEEQAAEAVRHLVGLIVPDLRRQLADPQLLIAFVSDLAANAYERYYYDPLPPGQSEIREKGRAVLRLLGRDAGYPLGTWRQVSEGCGAETAVLMQMLPHVALLCLGALKVASEGEVRSVAGMHGGARGGRPEADAFAMLADLLHEADLPRRRREVAGLMSEVLTGRGPQRG
ncbi:MAG: hypothetical protein KDJ41_06490 [Hyphomicrobiaceae bacterium]|nr:hypothetical protein [Hyphomicrobiaceae bacterium]